jgi:sugar phosphate isomerase/epimerase
MAKIDMEVGYQASIDAHRKRWDSLLPALEKHGVTIGVQNHCDHNVGSAVGLAHLLEGFDPKRVGAVLDPAHCGLDGEPEDMAIDIVWPHLVMVNLKNAFYRLMDGLEAGDAVWEKHWTTGPYGLVSWPKIIADLKKRGYKGTYCLTAEYRNWDGSGDLAGDPVDPLIAKDVDFTRSLLEGRV